MAGLLDILFRPSEPNSAPAMPQASAPQQQQPVQPQQMAPQPRQQGSGGGMADFFAAIAPAIAMLDPRNQQLGVGLMQMNQHRQKERQQQASQNQTVKWLTNQGLGQDEAAYLASDPAALRAWYGEWKAGSKPDWKIQRLINEDGLEQDFMVDMKDPTRRNPIGGPKRADNAGLLNAGNGAIYDPNTKSWLTAPNAEQKPPEVETFYDGEGREYKAQWNPQKRDWEAVGGSKLPSGMSLKTNPDGSVELTQGPGAGQKLTEQQGKDVAYYTRGLDANTALETLEPVLTDWTQENAGKLPLGLGNYVREPSFRQAKQAADSFLAAVLRKDTGAAITKQEFDLYGPMFLPVPGDDPSTMQQKRRAREVALLAIRSGLGTADAIAQANRIVLGLPEDELPLTPLPSSNNSAKPKAKGPVVIDGYTIEEIQ